MEAMASHRFYRKMKKLVKIHPDLNKSDQEGTPAQDLCNAPIVRRDSVDPVVSSRTRRLTLERKTTNALNALKRSHEKTI